MILIKKYFIRLSNNFFSNSRVLKIILPMNERKVYFVRPDDDGVLLVEFGVTDHSIEICKKEIYKSALEAAIWAHVGKKVIF
jgi:hypothetical protein